MIREMLSQNMVESQRINRQSREQNIQFTKREQKGKKQKVEELKPKFKEQQHKYQQRNDIA